jgi:hypothetical protein
MRSLDSFRITRRPDEATTEERIITALPECLVYDARFGAAVPPLPLRWRPIRLFDYSRHSADGYEEVSTDGTLRACIAFPPSAYSEPFHAYAVDTFQAYPYSRLSVTGAKGRLSSPWLFHTMLHERAMIDPDRRELLAVFDTSLELVTRRKKRKGREIVDDEEELVFDLDQAVRYISSYLKERKGIEIPNSNTGRSIASTYLAAGTRGSHGNLMAALRYRLVPNTEFVDWFASRLVKK